MSIRGLTDRGIIILYTIFLCSQMKDWRRQAGMTGWNNAWVNTLPAVPADLIITACTGRSRIARLRRLSSLVMRRIKAQFFLTYGMMGSIFTYLPLYLAYRGLTDTQIGWVLSTMGLAIILSPVLITFLADVHIESKTILAAIHGVCGASLLGLLFSESLWAITSAYLVFALAFVPVIPLEDALTFKLQSRHRTERRYAGGYHHVRVWGTIGFIIPAVILYGFLAHDLPISIILIAAATYAFFGMINAGILPRSRAEISTAAIESDTGPGIHDPVHHDQQAPAGRQQENRRQLPTLQAARGLLFEPRMLLFCIAMWLLHLAAAAHYAFYPIYLERRLGIPDEWIGLITITGVIIEIFFVLAFGRLHRTFGMKWVMIIGSLCTAARMTMLTFFPTVAAGVLSQSFHGIMVLVLIVTPPVYINHRAGDTYRNSMQGLYAMIVFGTGRIVGNIAAGYLADLSLLWVFAWAAALSLAAVPFFALAFRGTGKIIIRP